MKERPITFNADMVRALLAGGKTQTRRPVKFPFLDKNFGCELSGNELAGEVSAGNYRNCPFGAVGDRLYVRESFSKLESFEFFDPAVLKEVPDFWYWADGEPAWGDWTRPESGAVMPKVASRITLEITGVRVERLNSISEADAAAEGVGSAVWFAAKGVPEEEWTSLSEHGAHRASHINNFATLWESIYGEESWQSNPWVWVIMFKVIKKNSSLI